jgi:hypothetical protein
MIAEIVFGICATTGGDRTRPGCRLAAICTKCPGGSREKEGAK